jgi:hypothetical protein
VTVRLRASGWLAAIAMSLLPALIPGLATAQPSDQPSDQHSDQPAPDRPEPTLTISTITPLAPTAADRIVVRGTVGNPTTAALHSVRVRLRAGNEPVRSRSELAAQARSKAAVGDPIDDPGSVQSLPDVPADGHTGFTLSTAVRALALPGLGVYPLGVDLRGDDGSGVELLDRLRTWLPYGPAQPDVAQTRIAWLWPLVGTPDRNPDGTFPNDALATELRPGGRLAVLLGASARATAGPTTSGRPLTRLSYAIDPALLEAVAAMAEGYSVRHPDGRLSTGTGQAAARAWLAQLRGSTAANPVVALPYGDPDVVALVRAGRTADVSLASASATFRQLVDDVLGPVSLERVAWPPGGLITQAALDALTGVDTVVLSGTALPPLPQISYTQDAATTLPAAAGGTLRALVSDPALDDIVAGPQRATDTRLAEQRFLAETLMITAEKPSLGRSVLIAPPRRWAPSAAWPAALLRDSASVPWLHPAALSTLIPAPNADATRGPLTYPAAAQRAELPAGLLARQGGIGGISRQLATFRAILTDPEAAGVPAVERALLRCSSSAWRTDPGGGLRLRHATSRMLTGLVNKVRITTRGEVSLASKRSTIPVSVANDLPQPVRVQVALQSTAARLLAEDSGVKVISGGHQIQLSVRLQAPSAGVFPVTARLLTPEGRPYGSPVKLLVHATRYGTLALAITGAAFVVLGLTAALRLGRRLRAASRAKAGR